MDTEQLNEDLSLSNKLNNPFASPTEEAEGSNFVGRKSELEEMYNYVVNGDKIHNYHIVGLPRIGKSSLLKSFKKMLHNDQNNLDLVIIYLSLDTCSNSEEFWKSIGKSFRKELKKNFGAIDKYRFFEEELEFEEIDDTRVDYEYVCSIARSMKTVGFWGLLLLDEFDSFSSIAERRTVGQFRTLFSSSDFGIRAVVASRRMVERIEKEVQGAVNSDVSILAATFVNGCKLKAFNKDDMKEYWQSISNRIGHKISDKYIQEVECISGSHPCLLNLVNGSYWAEQKSYDYLCDDKICLNLSKELINKLHDSFNWAVWRDMEKWQLLRSLILSTWGPDAEIPNDELSELSRYGVINADEVLSEFDGPIRIAISRYFTDWMNLKRYILPFGDEWSKAEGNMRSIIKCFCNEMYRGNEEYMVNDLGKKHLNDYDLYCSDPRYTAEGRFSEMRRRRDKNIRKYPDMSTFIIDYSNPSDLPEIFFKREWSWFGQVFGQSWASWSEKFSIINEIRNIKLHNNQGIPLSRIDLAKKYCHELNEKIEAYIVKWQSNN